MNNWINKIIIQKTEKVLFEMPKDSVDLVFTDPPYNIGVNYGKYKDNLTTEEYMLISRKWWEGCYRVLRQTGSIYVLHYPDVCSKWLSFLEEIGFIYRKWISWIYSSNIGHSKTNYTTAHRTILFMTKSDNYTFNSLADPQPYKNLNDKRIKERIKNGHIGITPYDWWNIELVKNTSKEKTEWKNQIPLDLVERIIKISSNEGDVVLDPFMGSGTTAVAANINKRKYIGFDIDPKSKEITEERIKRGY